MAMFRPSPRLVAVLGPTNTGKTHLAIERMLGHRSGMIGFPLRRISPGAAPIKPLMRRLVPEVEYVSRPRFSTLSYTGYKKVTRLPPRSAVVAFAIADVFSLAELIRRQRGGTAVVLGALSPRARNA